MMQQSRRWGRLVVLSSTAVAATSCASHRLFPEAKAPLPVMIYLDNPDKVGDRDSVEIIYSSLWTERTTWHGYDPTTEQYATTYHLITNALVLSCDAANHANRVRYHIQKLTELKKDAEVDLLPPNTDVIGSLQNGSTVFTINGQSPKRPVTNALECLLRLENDSQCVNWKHALNLLAPHRPAETWPIDAASMATELNSDHPGMKIVPADVSGEAHFVNIAPSNHILCVNLQAKIVVAHNFFTPGTKTDQGYTYHTTSGSTDSHYEWVIPLKPGNLQQYDFQSDTKYQIVGEYNHLSYVQDCANDWEEVMRELPHAR
jgi:hypothetical protein